MWPADSPPVGTVMDGRAGRRDGQMQTATVRDRPGGWRAAWGPSGPREEGQALQANADGVRIPRGLVRHPRD